MKERIRGGWLLLTWPVAGLALLLAKASERFAEYGFARGIYRAFHGPVALLTGLLPFSLAELILYALVPAVLILLAVWRYLATEPLRRARRHPDQAAAVLFSAVCALLSHRTLTRRKDETLRDFATRVERPLKAEQLPSLLPLADAYGAQLYGNHPTPPEPFREAYLRMRAAASPGTRFVLVIKRILSRNHSLI